MRYNLVLAAPSDRSWLDQLRRSVYQELFQATWGAWDEARHQRQFAECIERGDIRIIEIDGSRVGMIQVLDKPDAIELAEIQIEPKSQRRSIGSQVLMDIIKQGRASQRVVRLSVALKNPDARRFYERLGFALLAQTETHYQMECR